MVSKCDDWFEKLVKMSIISNKNHGDVFDGEGVSRGEKWEYLLNMVINLLDDNRPSIKVMIISAQIYFRMRRGFRKLIGNK